MTSKTYIVDLVNFVFLECARFQAEMKNPKEIIPNSPEAMEFFYKIPHPEVSWSFQVCGKTADRKLYELAELAASNAGLLGTVEIKSVRNSLADILVRKFQKEKRAIDVRSVERSMSEAIRKVVAQKAIFTHFIPCHLMWVKTPDSFRIGPVEFYTQGRFRRRIFPLMKEYLSQRDRSSDVRVLADLRAYYRTFGWTAEVSIFNCDAATSKNVAYNAVVSALNCVKVLFGSGNTYRMSIAGPALKNDFRATLASSEGDLHYSASYGWPGVATFPDDWWKEVDGTKHLTLFEVALQSVVDPMLVRPLSARFLDSAHWYGEAVSETSQAAKIVKYVTAIERMIITDAEGDITSKLADRLSALSWDWTTEDSWNKYHTQAKTLYDLRSKLVHGSLSPNSKYLNEGVKIGSELSRIVILNSLTLLDQPGLLADKTSAKKWGQVLDELVKGSAERRTSITSAV